MKKLTLTVLVFAMLTSYSLWAQVGINSDGSSPNNSAMLDVQSTDKGFLPPRMTEAQRDAIGSTVAGLLVWCSNCGTDGELQIYNGTAWTNTIGGAASVYTPPSIGDYYQGGVVFYLDGSGGGFICAVSDQSSGAEWGCYGTTGITGADGTAIGTGFQNTIDIAACCTTPGIAADICANLLLNGYDDWFLPSRDELNEMYQNKAVIDSSATANGGAAFVTATSYWSSSEYSSYYGLAWIQTFDTGGQIISNKDVMGGVRAVRAF